MSKWEHSFIEENNQEWEKGKLKRIEERREKIEKCEKNSRMKRNTEEEAPRQDRKERR